MTRLQAICSLIQKADTIADVGCDHGLVAKYVYERGLAKNIIASDIAEPCLDKAKKALSGASNVKFVCCDGIDYFTDEAIIAGMGGRLICDILLAAREKSLLPTTLVLMPHRDAESLRRTLYELNYAVNADFMIKDHGRFYTAIRARKSEKVEKADDLAYIFGMFYTEPSQTLAEYLKKLYITYSVAPEQNAEKLKDIRACMRIQDK